MSSDKKCKITENKPIFIHMCNVIVTLQSVRLLNAHNQTNVCAFLWQNIKNELKMRKPKVKNEWNAIVNWKYVLLLRWMQLK